MLLLVVRYPFSCLDPMCIYILLIFVRFADFISCQIVKWLKSPNGANIVCVVLTTSVLSAIAEILETRIC